jgi:hypothetical protein
MIKQNSPFIFGLVVAMFSLLASLLISLYVPRVIEPATDVIEFVPGTVLSSAELEARHAGAEEARRRAMERMKGEDVSAALFTDLRSNFIVAAPICFAGLIFWLRRNPVLQVAKASMPLVFLFAILFW